MDYHSEAGTNLIEKWYLSQSAGVQADFDRTLKDLSIAPDWHGMKEFKSLGRKGLCEIRFKTKGVQYRPLGTFGPEEQTFTIWVGCFKKMQIYDPPNAIDLAFDRISLYRQKRGTLRERII